MKADREMSRRNAVAGVVGVGLAALGGGFAYVLRRRAARLAKRELPGDPFLLPAKAAVENRMVDYLQISPDGTQIGVVLGNLTQKAVYVAGFPPKSASDYRLVAEFGNCFKVDGLNWNYADPTRLSCKVTEINCEQDLPGIVSERKWREFRSAKVFGDKDFASHLCLLSTQGTPPSKVCPLTTNFSDGNTAATAWATDNTLFCSDRRHIDRCCLQSGQVEAIYSADSDKNTLRGINGLAWRSGKRDLVALEYVRKGKSSILSMTYFDVAGNVLRTDVPVPSVPNVESLTSFRMDPNGEAVAAVSGLASPRPCAFYGELGNERHKELAVPAGESFITACVSTSGMAVLIFPDRAVQRARFEAPAEEVVGMEIPSVDEFSFRIVALG